MPGENVDDASLGVNREGDFGGGDPSGQVSEELGEFFVKRRATRVEEPLKLARTPARHDFYPHVQGGTHAAKRMQRKSVQVTSLDERYECTGNTGRLRHVVLCRAAADPHRAERSAYPLVVHPKIVRARP